MVDAEVHQIIGIGADLAVLGVSDSGFVGFIVGKGMKGENHPYDNVGIVQYSWVERKFMPD